MSTHRHLRHRRRRAGGPRSLSLRHGADLRTRQIPIPATRCFYGKRRYFTRSDAELVLTGLVGRGPRRREKRSYLCPACHGWHLTSSTLEQYRASQAVPERRSTPARAPIRLDVPPRTGPVPTPAEVARRRGVRVTAPAASPDRSIRARVRAFVRRIMRRSH
ncbi:hypothetical protein [Nocardia thailandica]|uniref:hypothetical protein n=1 Tax=Nocardia thailandica TaxID=257275 RepID=UPI0002DBAD27|nr:hypothetical protein [Nocardia thailandica]